MAPVEVPTLGENATLVFLHDNDEQPRDRDIITMKRWLIERGYATHHPDENAFHKRRSNLLSGQSCNVMYDGRGWWFEFSDSNLAMLFKLTWGGA